jgi:hypothetical protein
MNNFWKILTLIGLFVSVGLAAARGFSHNSASPALTIWSWDYPQDLSFIRPDEAAVAYYAGTAYVRGQRVFFKPRTKELKLAAGVVAYPVLRIESSGHARPDNAVYNQLQRLVDELQSRHHSSIFQIDFDATEDEHQFYSGLLRAIRKKLPLSTKLQITVLASWCSGDIWPEKTLYNEKIAMLFSMGSGSGRILSRFDIGENSCIGLSIDEPRLNRRLKDSGLISGARKIFVFSSRPWSLHSWSKFKQEVLQ